MHLLRNPRTASRRVGDQAAIVKIDSNRLFILNGVGTRVWDLLATPRTVQELAAEVSRSFEVSEADALRDCEQFCQDLVQKCLAITTP
jgi:glucan biosynthesis protein